MKEIPCIFCNTTSDIIAISENGYTGKRCAECDLIYLSPRPSFEEIIDLYGHDEAQITARQHIFDEHRKRLYAKHHLKVLQKYVKQGDLLEIGAGAGFFLDEAKKAGFNSFGLEFNPIQAQFMREVLHIPCEESPLNTTLFNGQKFDVIYHCDVISHLYDPFSDFRTMNEALKDNGVLFFETGNFAEMDSSYYPYINTFMYPDHLFFFSLKNLEMLLEKTGFELLKVKRFSILPQLRIKRLLASPDNQKPESNEAYANAGEEEPHHKSISDTLKIYVNYLLRYKIGALAAKKKRPQTMLICARKKK